MGVPCDRRPASYRPSELPHSNNEQANTMFSVLCSKLSSSSSRSAFSIMISGTHLSNRTPPAYPFRTALGPRGWLAPPPPLLHSNKDSQRGRRMRPIVNLEGRTAVLGAPRMGPFRASWLRLPIGTCLPCRTSQEHCVRPCARVYDGDGGELTGSVWHAVRGGAYSDGSDLDD